MMKALNNSPALSDKLQEAIVRRQAGPAEHDSHTLNLVVGGTEEAPTVKNIDLQFSFKDPTQPGDLKPHWEKQVSVVSTLGGTVRSALAGKPIPTDTREILADFLTRADDNPRALLATGLSAGQAQGVIGRSQWFVDKGTFPASHRNHFYESLNRLTSKVLVKPQPELTIETH
jgi:hypothetical protein